MIRTRPVRSGRDEYGFSMDSASRSASDRREAAFVLAERIRQSRNDLIDRVRSGSVSAREVLESTDPFVRGVKVVAVIESLPGLGKVKARRILEDVDISANDKVHDLDRDQVRTLLLRLDT